MRGNRRILAAVLMLCLLLGTLAGCARRENDGTVRVVCTVFPIYEWARGVVGETEGVEVILLVDNGTDLHSFQPTTQDLITMISSDLLLYVGGASESWVEQGLKNREDTAGTVLDLSTAEGVILRSPSAESIVEEHDHSHGHDEGHDAEHTETDEHIWLSLTNAAACTEAIADALCALDAANAEQYRQNAETYVERLLALDGAYADAVAQAKEPTLLFADRFPFVYLAEDYGIRYVAAHAGCTTEVDATPSTVIHLAEHVDEWGLRTVCVTESSDGSLAQSVIRATEKKDQRIAVLDSMQSVTAEEIASGTTYFSIMEENLSVLRGILEE